MLPRQFVEKYDSLREKVFDSHPLVLLEGKTYPWVKSSIAISLVPRVLKGCSYYLGLEAKRGEKFEFSPESKKVMTEGSDLHEELGAELLTSLGVVSTSSVKEEDRAVEFENRLIASEGKEQPVTELYVPGYYNNIYFGGILDYCLVDKGMPILVEEWKFSKKVKITEKHKVQVLLYCYFLYKLFNCLNFSFSIKVWDRKKWSLDEQLDYIFQKRAHQKEPGVSQDWIFDAAKIGVAEHYLDKTTAFFNGQTECEEHSNLFCKHFCPAAKECKPAQDWD